MMEDARRLGSRSLVEDAPEPRRGGWISAPFDGRVAPPFGRRSGAAREARFRRRVSGLERSARSNERGVHEGARADVAAFASPDTFHWAPTGLPKTRSGKIMRRILRKIAAEGAEVSGLGDTSTLADPGIVDERIASHAGASK